MALNIKVSSSDWIDLSTRGYTSGMYLLNAVGAAIEYSTAATPVPGTTLVGSSAVLISGTYLWVRGSGDCELYTASEWAAANVKTVPVMASTTSSGRDEFRVAGVRTSLMQRNDDRAPCPVLGGSKLAASDLTLVSGSGTVTLISRRGLPCLKIDLPAGTFNAQFKVNPGVNALFDGDIYIAMEGGYSTGILKLEAYHGPGATLAPNYTFQGAGSFLAAPQADNWQDQGGIWTWTSSRKNLSISGSVTWPMVVGDNKIVITPQSGQAATLYIYAIGYGGPKKGRICVTAADGEPSWLKLGAPIFNRIGIPTTSAIIPSGLGVPYATIEQYRAYIDAGNCVIGHGPNLSSYAGNLISNYATTAERMNDIMSVLEFMYANGLYTPGAERCYTWPQGVLQQAYGDTELLDAAYAAGIRFAYGASVINAATKFNAAAATRLGRLNLPYTTPSWGGSTAAQVALTQAVVDKINDAATYGGDVFLAFHRIVPDSTPDANMNTITHRVSDVTTIANAIKTQVDAGKLDAEMLTTLALRLDGGGYWGLLY